MRAFAENIRKYLRGDSVARTGVNEATNPALKEYTTA